MPVVHAPETEYAKEMRRWEAHHTQFGPPGRPWGSKNGPGGEFPKRIYKAVRETDGTRKLEGYTVQNELEQQNMLSRGFCLSQEAALEALDQEHTEHGKLAAEINYEARRMSDGARAEIEAAQQAAGARHLPVIPETPKKRRGRPARIKADLVQEAK